MPAMAGSLLKAGIADVLYLSELIGVVLMYGGFLLATAPAPAGMRRDEPVPAAQPGD